MLLPLAALLMSVGGLVLIMLGVSGRDTEQALASRLTLIGRAPIPGRAILEISTSPATAWSEQIRGALRSIFAFRMRRSWGVKSGPLRLLSIGLIAALTIGLVGQFALHLPSYLLWSATLGAFFLVPRMVLLREQHIADERFSELLPDAIDMVVRIVRAGLPVAVAIRTVGLETDAPLNTVFLQIAGQAEIGIPLDEALGRSSTTIGNSDFRFFSVAVALQQATGGNLAETLEALSQIIRRRRAVRLKSRATTSEVRISAIVLGAMPFFVSAALYILAPAYFDRFFTDQRATMILVAALLLLLIAGVTMRAMIRNVVAAVS